MSDIYWCESCGAALPEGTSSRRLYCDACRKLRKKETDRACYQKYRIAKQHKAAGVLEAKPKTEKPAPPPKTAPEKKLSPGGHRKVDKPCKECGTMMYGVDPGRFYCDACKKRRYAKPGTDTGTQPIIVKPKTNHDLLVDDNAAAAAKGMSYGHFKEWERRQKELKERGEI